MRSTVTAAAHDWLELRSPVDDAARRASLPLLDQVAAALAAGPASGSAPLTVVDLGAGTGNSALWFQKHLTPRLGGRPLRWVLLDTDAASLRVAADRVPDATTVTVPVTRLPRTVAALIPDDGGAGQLLLTCSALLDVLTGSDLDAVVQTLSRFRGLGLFLLSITDDWRLAPDDVRDEAIRRAFTAHQQRGDRLGATGARAMLTAAELAGAGVTSGASPWHVSGPRDREFIDRFLTDRVKAAVDEEPALAKEAGAWLQQRRKQAETDLGVTVAHLDVLVDARRPG